MYRLILSLIFGIAGWTVTAQTTVTLTPEKDNTLYEDPSGALSNGLGQHMFAGRTAQSNNAIRRAVIDFDIAGQLPANANITAVTLRLNMSRSISGNEQIALHRVTNDWGEGSSNAPGQEGGGAAATLNDATWIHTFYSATQWTAAGGDYQPTASATASVGGVGVYTWSTAQLTADVQDMLNNPAQNHGWILIGNEATGSTAKRFDTKDHPTAANRPQLQITYTLPPVAQPLVINEMDYDMPGTDSAEFIELRNNDTAAIDLSNYAIELVNGSGGGAVVYQTIPLPAIQLAPGDYFVLCGDSNRTTHCDMDISPSINLIQNGAPDAVAVKFNGTTIVDALSYEGNAAVPYREISGSGLLDDSSVDDAGLSRMPDGEDTDFNNQDFSFQCITPGGPNGPPQVIMVQGANFGICPGETDTIFAQGAAGTWQWQRNGVPIQGATDSFLVVDTSGLYNVALTIGFCTDTADQGTRVFFQTPPVVELGADTTVCSTYQLDAGNFGAQYLWNTGSNNRVITAFQSGTYSVTVTQNTCTDVDSIDLVIGSPFSIFLPFSQQACDSTILNPGQIAGAHYSWNTGDTTSTLTVNQSGIYRVEVSREGCFAADSVEVTIDTTPTVSVGPDVATCDSAVIIAQTNATGNFSWQWNSFSNDSVLVVFQSGLYWAEVNNNGCTNRDSVQVTIFPSPTVSLPFLRQDCESVTLDAGPGFASYQWSNGDTSRQTTVTTSGTYRVTVTNADGCKAIDATEVTIFGLPEANLGPDTTNCIPITLSVAEPDASYSWNTGASDSFITVTTSGIYTVSVEKNGCISQDSVVVTIADPPVAQLGADTSVCGALPLRSPSPGQYLWSTGSTDSVIIASTSGTYSVTITNGGCIAVDSITLQITPAPPVSIGPDTTHCGPYTLTATLSSGQYQWSTGDTTPSITVAQSGLYTVSVTDGNGCVSIDQANVTIDDRPQISLGPDTATCGRPVQLNAGTNAYSYQWNTGDTTSAITISQRGTYSVTATGKVCTASDTIQVQIYAIPPLELGPAITACNRTRLTGNVNGLYQWNTGATTRQITVTSSGTYVATVTDSNGCVASDSIQTTILNGPDPDLGMDRTVCDSVILDAGAGDSYQWSTGATTSRIVVNSSGTYSVIVRNNNGCVNGDTVQLAFEISPLAAFTVDTVDCPTFRFNTQSTGTNLLYEWNFGDGTTASQANTTHTYTANNQYAVWHVARNLCGTDTSRMVLEISCIPDGIARVGGVVWEIFPNPASHTVQLMQQGQIPAVVEVINSRGQVVMPAREVWKRHQWSLQTWPAGVYIVHIRQGKQKGVLRLLVL